MTATWRQYFNATATRSRSRCPPARRHRRDPDQQQRRLRANRQGHYPSQRLRHGRHAGHHDAVDAGDVPRAKPVARIRRPVHQDWETPEYKDAVAMLKSFWDAGYVHPDTPTFIQQQGAQSFYAGKFGMYPTNFFAFGIAWDRLLGINKNFRLNALTPVGFDGGKGVQFQDWGGNQITVLKKGNPERIKQVLGVLNYLAAPFGSQEYLNLWYGQPGTDFNFDEN